MKLPRYYWPIFLPSAYLSHLEGENHPIFPSVFTLDCHHSCRSPGTPGDVTTTIFGHFERFHISNISATNYSSTVLETCIYMFKKKNTLFKIYDRKAWPDKVTYRGATVHIKNWNYNGHSEKKPPDILNHHTFASYNFVSE